LRALRSEPAPKAPGESGGSKRESKQLYKQTRKNRRLRKALQVVRWSQFDFIKRDGWLERDELHVYVRALMVRAVGATREVAGDHPTVEGLQTLPSTRKRILYLYQHFIAAPVDSTETPSA
jgi:hypothetical protein